MLRFEDVLDLVGELSCLKYFPGDPAARIAIARLASSMANDRSQLQRLVARMTNGAVYGEWPGPHEMRACFCDMFKPRDGIEAVSNLYPDGIFPDTPPRIAPPASKRLEPGETVSDDPELDSLVRLAAKKTKIPPVPRGEIERLQRIQRANAQASTTREILDELLKDSDLDSSQGSPDGEPPQAETTNSMTPKGDLKL